MNKLTTAVSGIALLVGSAFAAVPQDSTKMTDQKMADTTATTHTAKKHVKKAKKTAPAATTATAAPVAK